MPLQQLPPKRGNGWIWVALSVLAVLFLIGWVVSTTVARVSHMMPGMAGMPGMPGASGIGFGEPGAAAGTWVGLVTVSDEAMSDKKRTAAVEVTMTRSGLGAMVPLYGMTAKMTEEGHGEEIALSASKIIAGSGADMMNGVLDSSSEAAWNQCFVTGGMGKGVMTFGLQGMGEANASLKGTLRKGSDADYAALAQKVLSGQAVGGVAEGADVAGTPAGPVSHPVTKTAAGLAASFMQLTESKEFEAGFTARGIEPKQEKAATALMDGLSDKVQADEKDQNTYVLGDLYLSMATTVYGMLRFEQFQDAPAHKDVRHDAEESAQAQADACEALMKNAVSAQAFGWKRVGGAYCLDVPAGVTRAQAVAKLNEFLALHK